MGHNTCKSMGAVLCGETLRVSHNTLLCLIYRIFVFWPKPIDP